MTDGLRKSHLRKAPQVGLSEVGLPDIYLCAIPIAKFTDIITVVQTNMQCVTELEKAEEDLNLNGWTVKDYMGARTQT